MQPKNPLFQKCLNYLKSLPNVEANIDGEPYFSSEVLADGKLTINTSGVPVNYICEIKTGITNDVIEQLNQYFVQLGERLKSKERPLLITRSLSNLVVDRLLEKNIEFIDVDGQIYLNSSGVYILVRNQSSVNNGAKSLDITNGTLQVMYALLSQPMLTIQNDDNFENRISFFSGVTIKTVRNSLRKLEELDYIKYTHERYEIIDYVKLLERWELGYSEQLRAKLLLETFSPIQNQSFAQVANEIKENVKVEGYFIAGELAASMITDYLRPIGANLHLISNSHTRIIAVKFKLKPDPNGHIAFFQTIGDMKYYQYDREEFQSSLVHPLLIHAELVQSGNSRLKETAQLIYDRYLDKIGQNYHAWLKREKSFK